MQLRYFIICASLKICFDQTSSKKAISLKMFYSGCCKDMKKSTEPKKDNDAKGER